MKRKIYFLFFVLFACITQAIYGQQTVQGQQYNWSRTTVSGLSDVQKISQVVTAGDPNFNMDNIKFWVGSGENKAALVVEWHDGKNSDAMVWGYKWSGDAYGIDMVTAIAKADPRFIFLTHYTGSLGNTIAGFGYDINGVGPQYLYFEGNTSSPRYPVDGIVTTTDYDYDDWTIADTLDHWHAGWYKGYWSYWVKEGLSGEWGYSGLGASSRKLQDGSWDGWSYVADMSNWEGSKMGEKFVAAPVNTDYTKGVFFVNEDWFGHNNSTINFLDGDGTWQYKAFQTENPGHELGATSQFGTVYGDNMYIVSKQDKDGGANVQGSRLTVCNARTMKVIKEFPTIATNQSGESIADGRSFLGVDENTGYVGTSCGIYLLDMKTMTIGDKIAGTSSVEGDLYNGQTGTMLRVGNRVFAVMQGTGILVINALNHTLENTITGSFGSIVQSKDGNIWASTDEGANAGSTLVKFNPYTLAKESISLPTDAAIPNSWYAWTADGFCASKQTNSLYWKNNGGWFGATKIYKYEIGNSASLNSPIFDSSNSSWSIYGAGFRIDPVTDEIYASMYKDFGSQDYTVFKLSASGEKIAEYPMTENYWFPAMPVFPDNYSPTIATVLENISFKGDSTIYLGDKIKDSDNLDAAIIKSVTVADESLISASILNDSLKISAKANLGKTKMLLSANSNGKLVALTINVTIIDKPEITEQPKSLDVVMDEKASFSIAATGGDLKYQWYRDDVAISGANSLTYSISKVTLAQNGGVYYCKVSNSLGEICSEKVTLSTKFIFPEITSQPVSLVKAIKVSGSFSVTARGGSLTYQWYKDAVAISGATSARYSISSTNMVSANSGSYYCLIKNDLGSIYTDIVSLSVLSKVAISDQPASVELAKGSIARFSVVATGDSLHYQWYKDAVLITGATSSVYEITSVTAEDMGEYHCVVKNAVSTATSSKASLSVVSPTGDGVAKMSTITVYPNPAKNSIVINTNGRIEIFSMSGLLLKSIDNYTEGESINVSDLSSGSYIIRICSESNTETQKLIKK